MLRTPLLLSYIYKELSSCTQSMNNELYMRFLITINLYYYVVITAAFFTERQYCFKITPDLLLLLLIPQNYIITQHFLYILVLVILFFVPLMLLVIFLIYLRDWLIVPLSFCFFLALQIIKILRMGSTSELNLIILKLTRCQATPTEIDAYVTHLCKLRSLFSEILSLALS